MAPRTTSRMYTSPNGERSPQSLTSHDGSSYISSLRSPSMVCDDFDPEHGLMRSQTAQGVLLIVVPTIVVFARLGPSGKCLGDVK
jgi:hypothetical protein